MQDRVLDAAREETYISVQEMLEYLGKNYVSTDPLRVQWEAMSEDDQEVFLHRAYHFICSLPFTGTPYSADQEGPFPRGRSFTENDFRHVKYAQAEQALMLSDTVTSQEFADRIRLRRAGVVQYSIGDLSEKFQDGLSASSSGNFFGLSESAYNYLSKWLRGGYDVCTSIKKRCGRP